MPVLSSSVKDARKTASTEPKCSTSLRDFVAPRPGVSEMASHSRRWVADGATAEFDKRHSRADSTYGPRTMSRLCVTTSLLNLWKDETFTNFRHFLPQYRPADVGFRAWKRRARV